MDEILKVQEVCDMLHISRTVVYGLIRSGQLEAMYVNNNTKYRKHPRIKLSAVQAYMEKNKIQYEPPTQH